MEMTRTPALRPVKTLCGLLIFQVFTVLIVSAVPLSARDLILTLREEGTFFEAAQTGLRDELASDFDTKEYIIDRSCTVNELSDLIALHKPKLVILMDNKTIVLYRKYQETLDPDSPVIPSISIMGVMIRSAIGALKNAAGISYEVPVVTSLVSLRSVLDIPMKKVGVINRAFLDGFLSENREFCKREKIDLVNVTLPDRAPSFKPQLKKAINHLLTQGVEAFWIPNDNMLLQPDIIQTIWIPAVRKHRIAVVVGVEVLVNPKLNFGTFAVLPDHVALGAQAAGMVYEIRDAGWLANDHRVDPPLAVYKIINLPQAKKNFGISDDKLKTIDKQLK